ncbi:MAG: triose-phosphate isomerase [Betaproteobacteria bacterium]|nr:triose-phosphate isomerase [Betaproteobacteria bacterium]
MRKPLVAGNWKMHGSLAANAKLLGALVEGWTGAKSVDCAVCVPFPYLHQARALLGSSDIQWGAQNMNAQAQGAFTGEISGPMLRDFGCRFVIVGHSERRQLFGESSEWVAEKFSAALSHGLVPVLCVGESLAQRESGQTEAVVGSQLDAVLNAVGAQELSKGVLAYEPVWAIGTGKTATPEQAQSVHRFLRERVALADGEAAGALRMLYGGSVKASNARSLFRQPDIDGALVGGASLQAEEFLSICLAARPKD